MKYRPWAADYKPPAPPDENSNVKKTPEEIEREIKVIILFHFVEIDVIVKLLIVKCIHFLSQHRLRIKVPLIDPPSLD